MGGEDPSVPAERRRQNEIGEPDETWVVFHERGFGLLDAGAFAAAGGAMPGWVDRHGIGAFRAVGDNRRTDKRVDRVTVT
jgi:hypothetical protein